MRLGLMELEPFFYRDVMRLRGQTTYSPLQINQRKKEKDGKKKKESREWGWKDNGQEEEG